MAQVQCMHKEHWNCAFYSVSLPLIIRIQKKQRNVFIHSTFWWICCFDSIVLWSLRHEIFSKKEGALIYALIMTQRVCAVWYIVPNTEQSHKKLGYHPNKKKEKTELLINCLWCFRSTTLYNGFGFCCCFFSGLLLNAICGVSGFSLLYLMQWSWS